MILSPLPSCTPSEVFFNKFTWQTICKLSVKVSMLWCHGKQSGQQSSVNCLKRKGATTLTIFVQSLRDIEQLKPIFMYMRPFLDFKIIDMLRCIILNLFSKVTLPWRVLYLKLLDFIVLMVDEIWSNWMLVLDNLLCSVSKEEWLSSENASYE